jgi:hypothetical protein
MATRKSSFATSVNEEVINHFGAIRLRIKGNASIKPTLFSLDEVQLNALATIPIVARNNIEPNRLANFTQQRAKLELRTTEIDETFQISKIIIFIRPVAKSFPETSVLGSGGSIISPSIVGPVGPQGIQGITGATGATGAQGPAGPGGTIPSFAETIESTTYNITGSYADVTGLTVTITPKLSNSKVHIQAVINTYLGAALTVVSYQILRNGTVIKEFQTAGFNNNIAQYGVPIVIDHLDSPGSASAVVYKIQAKCPNSVSAFVNEGINGGDVVYSSIAASEILQ